MRLTGIANFLARLAGAGRLTQRELEQQTAYFREILQANNTALGLIARIQEALESDTPLPSAEVRRLVTGVTVQTLRMAINLHRLTGKRYRPLTSRFHAIRRQIEQKVEVTPVLHEVAPVLPLAEVTASLAEVVGHKSAYLGEAGRLLGAHVPVGLATTVEAHRAFLREQDLERRITEVLGAADLGDTPQLFAACARVNALIEAVPVPADLGAALDSAVAALPGSDPRFAVRSSALQEGGVELSFAGQYRSLLNVRRASVVEAFKQVVASKYSPQAVSYRAGRGFDESEIAVCCCILSMVDARAGGVLYSAYSTAGGKRTLLQAVRGLGITAVDGSVEPDSYLVDPGSCRVVQRKLGLQATLVRSASGEGTERVPLAQGPRDAVLTDEEVLAVARVAWRLEAGLKQPLDLEWAIDQNGRVWVLQVRPRAQHAQEATRNERRRVTGATVLLEGGSRASAGAGCGPVAHVNTDLDILRCPPGAIVVTREANPRLAVLVPKIAALVADMGETAGHLATVARELRVPALFATRHATEVLSPRTLVTVDADASVVYAGRVEVVLEEASCARVRPRDANRELLASVSEHIVPLTVRDRLASGFSPRRCNSLHDIVRFCHQAAIEAVFELGDHALYRRGVAVRRLVSAVPIDCRVIDLGGGVRPEAAGQDLTIDDIACVPMRALWVGMTDPRVAWTAVRPVSARGFVSSIVGFGFDEDARVRDLGEPSYVFLSSDYLNLNSRIGYHFATIDTRVGTLTDSNYLSFRFVGGSTTITQRSRRAALIYRLLRRNGFETDCRSDLVNARIRHLPAAVMCQHLRLLGLLMQFVNHLDMVLTSDAIALEYELAFASGNYGFGQEEHG